MRNMKRIQSGFTLIELMIVIAIVAILVALAVPAYQDYTIRAKVGECVNAAAVPKLSLSEYYETVGNFPANLIDAGMSTQGDSHYCDTYSTYNTSGTGTASMVDFDIIVDEGANGVNCTGTCGQLQPRMYGTPTTAGGVDWRCARGGTAPADLKYLPSTCRGANT